MKNLRILTAWAACLAMLAWGCSKNPVSNDDPNQGGNTGSGAAPYNRSQLHPDGQVDTTATGYDVQGKLTVESEQGDVPFEDADLSIEFDVNGNLTGVSGTASIPPPSNQVEFTNPVQAEVGYYPGSYINNHIDDFTLRVKEDRWYFVFYFSLAVEMKLGPNDDPNAYKPFSIKAPVGGKVVMIIDYNDAMTYTYGEQDIAGASGQGDSEQGLLPFEPVMPLDHFDGFDAHSVRVGAFDVFKVLGVRGEVFRSRRFDFDVLSDDPLASMKAGEYAGINGEMDFTVGVKNIIGFTVPMGTASGAASFEAALSGVLGKCAVNGIVEPDNTWWPDFLGFRPAGQMTAQGHLLTTGDFSLAIAGSVGLLTPGKTSAAAGEIRVDNDALTLTAQTTNADTVITLQARVTKDSTEYSVILPPQLTFDGAAVRKQIDQQLTEVDEALADLEKATQDYEFELSLRGLRKDLPGIVDNAKGQIDDGVADAKRQIRDADDWCEVDTSPIDNLAKPYYDALNRLKAAAQNTADNNATRTEIEAALRDLASRDRINTSVKISGKVRRVICVGYSTTRSIDITVISASRKAQLLQAADHVRYIAETSDRMVSAKQVYDALNPREELQQIRDEIDAGLAQIPSVGEVGIIHRHSPSQWQFWVMIDGERKILGDYDPLDPAATADAVSSLIIDLMGTN